MGRRRRRARSRGRVSCALDGASRTCRRTRCNARGGSCRRFCPSPTDGRSTCSSWGRPPGSTCSGIATATATRPGYVGPAARSSWPATIACRPLPSLLERAVSVGRRRGIDLNPVDVTTEDGSRLLQAFVWPDQPGRLDRLRRAIDVVRHDPPELQRGDYVEALPELLRDRRQGEQLVIFQSASTQYVDAVGLERLHEAMSAAGGDEPLVFISTGRGPDDTGYALELQRFPGGRPTASRRPRLPRRVAGVGAGDRQQGQRAPEARAQAARQALAREARALLRRRRGRGQCGDRASRRPLAGR